MFIISKIVGFLLDPILWIFALIIIAAISRRRLVKKRLYTIAVISLLLFSNPWIVNNLWYAYQAKPNELAQGKKYDAVILLGGLAGLDEHRGKGIFNQTADRFIQTARLYETGIAKKILVTGGDPSIIKRSQYNEADFLTQNLMDLRIPSGDIIKEANARNTIENAQFSKTILDSIGAKGPFLLVTSAIHMPRALKSFRKSGMEVIPYPCNYIVVKSNTDVTLDNFMPSGQSLYAWKILLKEWVGMLRIS